MNATLNQFAASTKKANPVESIAARIANRQVIHSQPYEGMFNTAMAMQGKEFGLMTRSIPVSKTSGIKASLEPPKRGTQLNFYSHTASIQKPMTQTGSRKAHDSVTRAGDESGNTSVQSYNNNQIKGFSQAQSAL